MNSYDLSRKFIDFAFENPTKIKPNHYAVYFFAIEHCNRLGWKNQFGLPTTMTMEAVGIRSYNTYINTFNDLVKFKFFNCVERSKNQHSSNIIELSNFDKALDKALDKAMIKHGTKQSESTEQSKCSIDKPKTLNIKHKTYTPTAFNFRNSFLELGVNNEILNDWLAVRKKKRSVNSQTAFNLFVNEVKKSRLNIQEAVEMCAGRSWASYKVEYDKGNKLSTNKPKQGARAKCDWN